MAKQAEKPVAGKGEGLGPAHVEIYGLHDPDTGEVRYVGKANNSARRLASHLRDAKRRDTPVYRWVRKLRAAGKTPKMLVLACVHRDAWEAYERMLIADFRLAGARLLNVADGGDQPSCPAPVRAENARRLNELLAADPVTKRVRDLKRAISNALRNGCLGEPARAKLRLAAAKAPHLFGEYAAL